MLTKKHFEAIAQILKGYTKHRADFDAPVNYLLDCLVGDFANYLEKQNEWFDRDKFLKACEIK